jgi:NTP pyrophosphatase (non-canonical NTP hydrolase)
MAVGCLVKMKTDEIDDTIAQLYIAVSRLLEENELLREKLDMETSNPFQDQTNFMIACDQTVADKNPEQYSMYLDLISEETEELKEAIWAGDEVEQLDALIDILVVTIGAINSFGADGQAAWDEVMKTNFAKIDPETGKVRKRDDGKVLKPDDWKAPELEQFLKRD